jgi:hypothetical protein
MFAKGALLVFYGGPKQVFYPLPARLGLAVSLTWIAAEQCCRASAFPLYFSTAGVTDADHCSVLTEPPKHACFLNNSYSGGFEPTRSALTIARQPSGKPGAQALIRPMSSRSNPHPYLCAGLKLQAGADVVKGKCVQPVTERDCLSPNSLRENKYT